MRSERPRARAPRVTQVVKASAFDLPISDGSVDLVVTSPPYFALRSYTDDDGVLEDQVGAEETPSLFVDSLIRATKEAVRVLKDEGSLWVNLGDKYAGTGGHNNKGIGAKDGRGPASYNKSSDAVGRQMVVTRTTAQPGIRAKSLIGLPWRYALRVIDDLGLILRAEVVWSKPNGLPESVRDRVRRSHETWFHFTKQGSYFQNIDAIREEYAPDTARRHSLGWSPAKSSLANESRNPHLRADDAGPRTTNPLGKLPGSVWTIPTEPLRIPAEVKDRLDLPDHFAAFPQEWPRRIIEAHCPPGGVVLDPFGGTGTTAGVAHALDRIGISVDLSSAYCRLAKWRIFESGHFEKSRARSLRTLWEAP